ncbi:MAG: hypothetical protein KBS38_04010 [Bacteroidales bacterium]|nr:hypothetical protein [Candidatus Cacconaster caballi]
MPPRPVHCRYSLCAAALCSGRGWLWADAELQGLKVARLLRDVCGSPGYNRPTDIFHSHPASFRGPSRYASFRSQPLPHLLCRPASAKFIRLDE